MHPWYAPAMNRISTKHQVPRGSGAALLTGASTKQGTEQIEYSTVCQSVLLRVKAVATWCEA